MDTVNNGLRKQKVRAYMSTQSLQKILRTLRQMEIYLLKLAFTVKNNLKQNIKSANKDTLIPS